jgi:hypothetical protein
VARIDTLGRLAHDSRQSILNDLRESVDADWRAVLEQQTTAEVSGSIEAMMDVYRALAHHERTRLASVAFEAGDYFVIAGATPSRGGSLPATDGYEYFTVGGWYNLEDGKNQPVRVIIPTLAASVAEIERAYRQAQMTFVSELLAEWNSAEWGVRKQRWDENAAARKELADLKRQLAADPNSGPDVHTRYMEEYGVLRERLISPYLRVDETSLIASARYTF